MQARLLFHEAARYEVAADEATASRRLSLLQEAADAAKQATVTLPGELSKALQHPGEHLLRSLDLSCTTRVELFPHCRVTQQRCDEGTASPELAVENSSFVGDADSGKAGKLPTMKQAQFIREQFAGAHEACQQALDLRQPLVDEPVITVVDLEGGRRWIPAPPQASISFLLHP